ncbi:MAG: methionine-rich copper-binding protein CopC [Janthinobacterium sp.]|jgi:methionine-rich copper-binding protein CopC
MKRLHAYALGGIFAAAMLAAPLAAAHAGIQKSTPAANAMLVAAPPEIVLTFNEKIESAFSSITLTDANGKSIGAAKARIDASDPVTLRLAAPALSSGMYSVQWIAVGHDGHRRTGKFKFTVK